MSLHFIKAAHHKKTYDASRAKCVVTRTRVGSFSDLVKTPDEFPKLLENEIRLKYLALEISLLTSKRKFMSRSRNLESVKPSEHYFC